LKLGTELAMRELAHDEGADDAVTKDPHALCVVLW
jgi:hypothetical protein